MRYLRVVTSCHAQRYARVEMMMRKTRYDAMPRAARVECGETSTDRRTTTIRAVIIYAMLERCCRYRRHYAMMMPPLLRLMPMLRHTPTYVRRLARRHAADCAQDAPMPMPCRFIFIYIALAYAAAATPRRLFLPPHTAAAYVDMLQRFIFRRHFC